MSRGLRSVKPSEAEFQSAVIAYAELQGWRVIHTPDSPYTKFIPKSARGFPDLLLMRGNTLMFRELKTEEGRLSSSQKAWMEWLLANGYDFETWRPGDWRRIESQLAQHIPC